MKLNNQIGIIVYENKYKDLSNQLDRLRQEKLINANQEIDQKSVKERIKEYKSNFYKNVRMTVFSKETFDILVKRVIIGTVNDNGEKDPYSVVLIMNT